MSVHVYVCCHVRPQCNQKIFKKIFQGVVRVRGRRTLWVPAHPVCSAVFIHFSLESFQTGKKIITNPSLFKYDHVVLARCGSVQFILCKTHFAMLKGTLWVWTGCREKLQDSRRSGSPPWHRERENICIPEDRILTGNITTWHQSRELIKTTTAPHVLSIMGQRRAGGCRKSQTLLRSSFYFQAATRIPVYFFSRSPLKHE